MAIVSYRCRELLRDCLNSLREHPPQRPMRVIVTDNASADGTVEMVRSEFAEVELIASERNLGFAAATNRAIAAGEAEYVLALNPDTAVSEGALETVAAVLDADPEVGIAGARLLRADGSFDHAAKRSFPTPLSALGHFSGIGRREGAAGKLAAYRAPNTESGRVDAVNGAFMMMRRSAFESLGGFDEGYWMYMEDLDLCFRAAEAGWITWYEPAATVMHIKAGTSGEQRSPRLNWAFHRGMYRFYRRHYAAQSSALLNGAVYTGIAAKLAGSVTLGGVRRALPARRSAQAGDSESAKG